MKECNHQSHEARTEQQDAIALQNRLSRITHKILVLSGKGGVGKSTVAANLAMALARAGKSVGLLDIDVHGPSIPKIMGLEGQLAVGSATGIVPIQYTDGLKVMSIGFLIKDSDEAVIWRGPLKYSVIKQFLKDVDWGDLDYLIVDSPPGTGDEPLSVAQLAGPDSQAVIVTTPQQLAISDVRKSIQFCRKVHVNILGVVENMSGFICPHCGESVDIFKTGGGRQMAADMKVPFLGQIPVDTRIVESGDAGRFFLVAHGDTAAAAAFESIIQPILDLSAGEIVPSEHPPGTGLEVRMKIAIPTANGLLCPHFGHCDIFTIIDVDTSSRVIQGETHLTPPAHEPGILPRWLHEQGANLIIAGGMGQRAQSLFQQNGVDVVVGAPVLTPAELVASYLAGNLQSGDNLCDH